MRSYQSIRWFILATIIVDCFVLRGTFAGVSRTQEADSLISSDHTKTWSLPASTDTLVGLATSGVLTNKTISGASNTITNLPAPVIGLTQVQDVFYGGGTTATYTLSYAPTLAAEVLCSIDGLTLIQGSTKDYTVTIAGPTVTLSSNLGVGQSLMCYYNKN